jgi:RNA polymerase sigma-70 factor (ECF subfamily)
MWSPALDEGDVVAAFVAGDSAALRAIYDEHQQIVYSFCRKAVGVDDAADVTQQVFLAAWRSREGFDRSAGSLPGWLMGIARHKVIDHLRTVYRTRDVTFADIDDAGAPGPATTSDSAAAPDAQLERHLERLLVAGALARLPEPGQTMVRLAFLNGLSHTEIAEQTDTPLGTVKSMIRRGLIALRRDLEELDATR